MQSTDKPTIHSIRRFRRVGGQLPGSGPVGVAFVALHQAQATTDTGAATS